MKEGDCWGPALLVAVPRILQLEFQPVLNVGKFFEKKYLESRSRIPTFKVASWWSVFVRVGKGKNSPISQGASCVGS